MSCDDDDDDDDDNDDDDNLKWKHLILSNANFAVWRLQMSVGKLQLPATPFTQRRS